MIKHIFFLLLCSSLLIGCVENSNNLILADFKPVALSTKEQQDSFIYTFIRHAGKLHKKANDSSKFIDFFDEYYMELASKHELLYLAPDFKDGYTYFCLSRIAPSLTVKKVAVAGRLKFDDTDSLVHYEEIYRTWKMLPDELTRKNDLLFSMLLNGEDLSPYYNNNSGEEEWIEFPDGAIRFDVNLRKWTGNVELYEE